VAIHTAKSRLLCCDFWPRILPALAHFRKSDKIHQTSPTTATKQPHQPISHRQQPVSDAQSLSVTIHLQQYCAPPSSFSGTRYESYSTIFRSENSHIRAQLTHCHSKDGFRQTKRTVSGSEATQSSPRPAMGRSALQEATPGDCVQVIAIRSTYTPMRPPFCEEQERIERRRFKH
jgi:hypothetical protein